MTRDEAILATGVVATVAAIFSGLYLALAPEYYRPKGTAVCYSNGTVIYSGPFSELHSGGLRATDQEGNTVVVYGSCVATFRQR